MKNQLLALTFLITTITFSHAQVNDVGVTAINIPEFGTTEFTNSYTVQMEVTNYGSADQNNVPISVGFPGLNYKYYEGYWTSLPDFNLLVPEMEGVTNNVDINIAQQYYYIAFFWEGYINIETPGTYTLETRSDDGSKLYIGDYDEDDLVVNNDFTHGMISQTGDYYFPTTGLYPIVITWFQYGGGRGMELYWESTDAGISREMVPDDAFFTNLSGLISETTGFIGAGNTIQYDFVSGIDLSELGRYDIEAFTSLAGDENTSNDTEDKTIYKVTGATLPVDEDFEGVAAFSQEYTSTALDIDGLSGFSFVPEYPGQTRLRFNLGYANSGFYSAMMDNFSGSDRENNLILTIDASGKDVSMNAIVAEFYYHDFNDEVDIHDRVFVRGSANDDWIEVFDWSQTNSFSWLRHEFNLALVLKNAGQQFSSTTQISFSQEDTGGIAGDGVGFDDVKVYERFNDMGIQMVTQNPLVADPAKTFSIDVTNFGSNAQTNVDITVQIDGNTPVIETISNINPLETIQYTFATPFDFSATGEYDLVVSTSLAGDEDTNNDMYTGFLYSISPFNAGLPVDEDFESTSLSQYERFVEITGANGFYNIMEADAINRTCTYCGVHSNGNKSLYVRRSSGSAPYKSSFYYALDLSAYSAAVDDIGLSFNFRGEVTSYDAGIEDRMVFVRGSDLDTWIPIYNWDENILEDQYVEVIDINLSSFLSTNGQDFSPSTQIRFGFNENSSRTFQIDEVNVFEIPDNDLDIVDLILPDPQSLTDSEVLSVEVRNRGFNTQSDYDVQFEVEDKYGTMTFVTEGVNIPIDFGETAWYTFSTPFDFTVEGEYTVTATVILAGDENNANDIFEKETGNLVVYTGGLPYFQDFETVPYIYDATRFTEITNAPGYNFVNDEDLTNRLNSQGSRYVSGNRSLEISRNISNNVYTKSDIYLAADLSVYDATVDQIALRFNFFEWVVTSTNKEDRQIFVRGSKDDEWIVLYNMNDNAISQQWMFVYLENISEKLVAYGQNFSKTFQIRFGHNQPNNWPFVIDDVYLYEIPDVDLRITDVRGQENPALLGGNESFEIDVKNDGLAAQSNFTIGVELYRDQMLIREMQKFIAGPVEPGEILTYHISNSSLNLSQSGAYELRVFPILPADMENEFESGIYTIVNFSIFDGDLPYFQDFEEVTVDFIDEIASPVDNIEGLSYDFDQEFQDQVELRFNSYSFFSNYSSMLFGDDEMSLGLLNTVDNDFNRHRAIFTLDLSEFDVSEDPILLDYFFWLGYNNSSYCKLFIRGSSNDSWIEIRNHFDSYNLLAWKEITEDNLSDYLTDNNQNFTSTFQVMFEHEAFYDNANRSFLVDNISIYHEEWGKELDIDLSGAGLGENAGVGTLVGELYPMGDVPPGFTYSLVSGEGDDDNDHFYLDVHKLKVANGGFDFETSTTASVRVKLTNNNGYSIYQVLEIPIVDANDAPDLDDQVVGTVAEGDPMGTIVGTITPGTDPDVPAQNLTYEIIGTTAFAIDPNTGQVTIDDPDLLDFETRLSETITVKVKDDGSPIKSGTGQVTINITDSNDPPTVPDQHLTMDRNVTTGTSLGFLNAFDEDAGQTVSFAVQGGPLVFDIDPVTGEVTVIDTTGVAGSSNSIYSVIIEVTDDAGVPLTTVFTLNIFVNEGPSIPPTYSFDKEENSTDKTVGQVTGTDPNPDQALFYSIIDGNDDNIFIINSASGTIFIPDLDLLDYETATIHVLEVQASDGGFPAGTATTTVTINVLDTNDDPVISGSDLSVDENTAAGTVIGTFSADDEDSGESATLSLTDDASGVFSFDVATGELSIEISANYESVNSYAVELTATDNSVDALTTSETFTVSIVNVNEAPTLGDATFSINENSVVGTNIGSITGSDVDANQTLTYAIVTDPSGLFSINSSTGNITVGSAGLDFETSASHVLDVSVTDNGSGTLSDNATVTININDVNEKPGLIVSDLTVPNTIIDGEVIGTLAGTDPDGGQTLLYSIVSGNESGAFSLGASTGALSIPSSVTFFAKSQYTLKVQVADDASPSLSSTATFVVNGVLTFPVVGDQSFSVKEGKVAGTQVGKVSAKFDNSIGVSFAITAGNDDGLFAIDGVGQITLASDNLDFETAASHTLAVSVGYNDTNNNTSSATVNVTVEDVNEKPQLLSSIGDWMLMVGDTDLSIDLNGNFTDPDADDVVTLSVIDKEDRSLPDWLTLVNGVLTAVITDEEDGEYVLEVTAKDKARLKVVTEFNLIVTAAEVVLLPVGNPELSTLIYPNPASSVVRIQGLEQGSLKIFSLSGKLMRQVSITGLNQPIRIDDLPKGSYFIRIEEESETLRFIKQ